MLHALDGPTLIARTILTVVNLVAFIFAVSLEFLYPAIALPVFYALLGWYLLSILVYRLPIMSRSVRGPTTAASSGGPTTGTAAGPALSSGSSSAPLDFCMYCGAYTPPGLSICPDCGKPITPN
ncbi:MAG: hypothetical protein WA761_09875 [Thermoplasmata archaeon]